jgi:4-aminobutyrate aminotransferase
MAGYVLGREGDVAAVVGEPMRAVPVVPPPGYWQAVATAAKETGTLLIVDEIPTGLGKTGAFFAHEHDVAVPDVIVLGKALGGGTLPIAAVLARADLDVVGNFAIGHYTHEKNPVTARAALATLDVIEEEGLVKWAAHLGEASMRRLKDTLQTCSIVGDVRGRGLLFGVEIVSDRDTRTPDSERAERILYDCLSNGLSFKLSAGNVLTLSPPLTITEQDLNKALSILEVSIMRYV